MDESKILELAREAGLQKWADAYDPAIIAFARLVAAAEREECADIAVRYVANGIRGVYSAIRSRTE